MEELAGEELAVEELVVEELVVEEVAPAPAPARAPQALASARSASAFVAGTCNLPYRRARANLGSSGRSIWHELANVVTSLQPFHRYRSRSISRHNPVPLLERPLQSAALGLIIRTEFQSGPSLTGSPFPQPKY